MSQLDSLVGMRLRSIEHVHDYVQLWFSAATLSAYSKTDISPSESALHKQCVVSVSFEPGIALVLAFSNDARVVVSALPDDYVGPEAFSVHFDSGVIVVE